MHFFCVFCFYAGSVFFRMQAAGPIYFVLVDSRRHTNKLYSNAGIRVMAVFTHIMKIYLMGFRYNTGALKVLK